MFVKVVNHPIADRTYALMRIVVGFLFLCHGLQKVFGLLGGRQVDLMTQIGFGGLLELICGAAICLGLVTRFAAFIASGMMAVAYVQFHWKPWETGLFEQSSFPVVNGGEPAVFYCFLFLYMAVKGAGPWSLAPAPKKK